MATKTEHLEKILKSLEEVGGIELSAIVSRQGLLMVSSESSEQTESEAFAAMTATTFMSALSSMKRVSNQEPKSIIIETENKHLIIYDAGKKALLIALVGNEGYLGLILNELKNAANKAKAVLS